MAKEIGARVVSIPWQNDFAKARNLALEQVHADWVLSLDADEALDPSAPRYLAGLMAREEVMGYLIAIRNYVLSPRDRVWDRLSVPNDGEFEGARNIPPMLSTRMFASSGACRRSFLWAGCMRRSAPASKARAVSSCVARF